MTRPSSSTPHLRSAAVQSRRISRLPAFTPVPAHSRTGRVRRDGWTPGRQAAFIGWLAETRCVRSAAAKVGMRREGAYRLRKRRGAEGFCAAWDAILGAPGSHTNMRQAKVTLDGLAQRIRHGSLRPILSKGRYIGTERKADNSALRAALSHADRHFSRAHSAAADTVTDSPEKTRSVSTGRAAPPPRLSCNRIPDQL